MATHVFHWRHGWIPLDHEAAQEKRHLGVKNRRDVAKAVRTLPTVPFADRVGPKHEIIRAAGRTKSHDLLPASWPKASHHPLSREDVAAFKGGSAEKHIVDGHFTPERAALHDRIIEGILAGHTPQDSPEYHLMGGGPASGKSTMMDAVASDVHDAAVVNADDVKAQLPEYVGKTGAAFTHEESSYIAKRAVAEAFRRRLNLTLDGTGDSSEASLRAKIDAARAAGYSVHGHYVTIPTELAVERAERRSQRTGRHVPRSVIEGTHRSVSRVLPKAAPLFDTLEVFDNTGHLKLIVRKRRGGPVRVLDGKLWRDFLSKAN